MGKQVLLEIEDWDLVLRVELIELGVESASTCAHKHESWWWYFQMCRTIDEDVRVLGELLFVFFRKEAVSLATDHDFDFVFAWNKPFVFLESAIYKRLRGFN